MVWHDHTASSTCCMRSSLSAELQATLGATLASVPNILCLLATALTWLSLIVTCRSPEKLSDANPGFVYHFYRTRHPCEFTHSTTIHNVPNGSIRCSSIQMPPRLGVQKVAELPSSVTSHSTSLWPGISICAVASNPSHRILGWLC